MQLLSPAGQEAIDDTAKRHGFSVEATRSMLDAVIGGNGSMAQFNHPEFSGSGQWMRGGMTMVSDMFNDELRRRVDALCSDLANLVAKQPSLTRSGSSQSQSQNDGSGERQTQAGRSGDAATPARSDSDSAGLFEPASRASSGDWWPAELQRPSSSGAQNSVRYAYFAEARRLAIDLGGSVTVYDTLDHRISGFSQQQSTGQTFSFQSQHGAVDVTSLPVVSSVKGSSR